MSESDIIKENLIEYFEGTSISKWKRTSKKKVERTEYRIFEHPAYGKNDALKLLVVDEGETTFDISDVIYFHIFDGVQRGYDKGDGDVLSICPKKYWDEDHAITDQQVGWVLRYFGVDFKINEPSENTFRLKGLDHDQVRQSMIKAGFVEHDMSTAGQRR